MAYKRYLGKVYCPPVEGGTLLLPVTQGCTFNACTFCSMYQGVPFRMLALPEIEDYLAGYGMMEGEAFRRRDRVYLVGADPFALSAERLDGVIDLVEHYLPALKTVTMFARISNIAGKTDEELRHLHERGVDDLYVGIESGLDDVLTHLNKGNTLDEAREQVLRLNRAGIGHRDMLMLGAAGAGRGREEALADAALENELQPDMVSVNTMSAFPGTALSREVQEGRFVLAGEKENLAEEKLLIENLDLPEAYFWGLHPMDSTPVAGILGEKKADMVRKLERAISSIDEAKYSRVYEESLI